MTETSHEIVSEQSVKSLCLVNAASQPCPQVIEEVSLKEASQHRSEQIKIRYEIGSKGKSASERLMKTVKKKKLCPCFSLAPMCGSLRSLHWAK